MKRLSIIDIVVSSAVVILIALTLVPAVARMQRTPAEAKCQSNLRRWAEAMALYTSDNGGRYPTNRYGMGASIVSMVPLSPPAADSSGKPIRFVCGVNWVEALYPYLWDKGDKTGQDWMSYMRCPAASNKSYPSSSTNVRMTYAFNRNLCENWSVAVRRPQKVMMLRELDRLTCSVLRPFNESTRSSSVPPVTAFLTKTDMIIGPSQTVEAAPHGNGSYIAFADGHVRFFSTDYYPKDSQITAKNSWDAETMQWYNYGPGATSMPELYKRSIAITP